MQGSSEDMEGTIIKLFKNIPNPVGTVFDL